MYSNNDWRNYQELYHHGILGMKWGVQNGPPYPLSAEDHNASEKKAGWRQSLSNAKEKVINKGYERDAKVSGKSVSEFRSEIENEYKKINESGMGPVSKAKAKNAAYQKTYYSGPRNRFEDDFDYDLRQKMVNTYDADLKKVYADNFAKKLLDGFKKSGGNEGYGYEKTTAACQKEIESIRNDERYKKAVEEDRAANKEYRDYLRDEKLTNKYETLAGIINAKSYFGDSDSYNTAQTVWGYKYEDLDQGTADSFSIYMLDKGVNAHNYNRKTIAAADNLESVRREIVKEKLGGHYEDLTSKNAYGNRMQLGHIVESALDHKDMVYPSEVDTGWVTKTDLDRAYKEYDKYKDITFDDDLERFRHMK